MKKFFILSFYMLLRVQTRATRVPKTEDCFSQVVAVNVSASISGKLKKVEAQSKSGFHVQKLCMLTFDKTSRAVLYAVFWLASHT